MSSPIESSSHRTGSSPSLLLLLLLALVFMLVVVPFWDLKPTGGVLTRGTLTVILLLAAFATRRRWIMVAFLLILVAIAAPLSWTTYFVENPKLFLVSCILDSIFFLVVAVVTMVSVFQRHLATVHSIYGAISGYLLVGLAFAMLYTGIGRLDERHLSIPAMEFAAGEEVDTRPHALGTEYFTFAEMVYFSFVTMSTLGYGDILPTSPEMRTLAWIQSVAGQFYIAIVVAWLISEIPGRRTRL